MKPLVALPLALLAAGALAAALAARADAGLSAEFARRLGALEPAPPGPPVTEADLARLPPPVQRWLRRAGVVGRPPVSLVHVTFDTVLHSEPGSPGMSGIAHQVDLLDPPQRLFFMTTRMRGLPVEVLHDYRPEEAGMQVRGARLFDIVNLGGRDFARIESVTFLNDLCAFAPSALIRPAFAWTPIDDRSARVSARMGPHVVTATLIFDDAGDLVDFASDDRADVSGGGVARRMRWTTPLRDHAEVGGRRVPTYGEAIWHRPEGPFVYGRFRLRDVSFDRLQEGAR